MEKSGMFYDALIATDQFAHMVNPDRFADLPDDWLVGVADIVDSTGLIAAGRYKTVNMVGAAVISAVMNALDGRAFPYVFGGDGAGFAIWPGAEQAVQAALAATRRWAQDEFDIGLRAALVPVRACLAADAPVRVARFRTSPDADYAMFSGGGLSWAEAQMKAGAYSVPAAPEGTVPDLTGLSCRWSNMASRHGMILSIVVVPEPGAEGFADIAAQVIALVHRLERDGHPSPVAGPGANWPPPGATLEAHAQRRGGPLTGARRKVWFESFVAWVLIRTGLKIGGFDARQYARTTGQNADFRKFDDGLKMTIDCDAATRDALTSVLDRAASDGIVRYGLSEQPEAMMTCIVPSFMREDHVHFIDGAAGGYTLAASRMKMRG